MMALEAVEYLPQPQDPLQYYFYKDKDKDFYNNCNLLLPDFEANYFDLENEEKGSIISTTFLDNQTESIDGDWNNKNCYPHINGSNKCSEASNNQNLLLDGSSKSTPIVRPKRRRAKPRKNKEEIENQRMTHIAVERNRRKQMNDYLSVLRSLMPHSYVQRGDQASIIGGAINFVKELEQRLQFHSHVVEKESLEGKSDKVAIANVLPFSEFFTYPQYSTSTTTTTGCEENSGDMDEKVGIADIEVTMVESHANLKIRSKKRPKQLLKMVSTLHGLRLTILHLNVTTSAEIVLYSISLKVEDDCKLGSVDQIATAVYQMLYHVFFFFIIFIIFFFHTFIKQSISKPLCKNHQTTRSI